MKIEIKSWMTSGVLFSMETDFWKVAVEAAVKSGANLSGADLSGANLSGADLSRANLSGAELSGADLFRADLSRADLSGANLSRANLSRANLSGADLSGANLSRANLSGANLSGANLSRADLFEANLSENQLTQFRDDIWAVLCSAPHEVDGLKQALIDGKVDGSTYTGECACLVGTIAKVAGKNYENLPILKPNSSRPAEIFFTLIKKGDTPETSWWPKMVVKWIDEWTESMTATFGKKV